VGEYKVGAIDLDHRGICLLDLILQPTLFQNYRNFFIAVDNTNLGVISVKHHVVFNDEKLTASRVGLSHNIRLLCVQIEVNQTRVPLKVNQKLVRLVFYKFENVALTEHEIALLHIHISIEFDDLHPSKPADHVFVCFAQLRSYLKD
jgi:hypothetical protein